MAKVEIYSKNNCPYCVKAKMLLDKKSVAYKEIDISGNEELREIMITRAGGRKTVPQIFINDYHVGGCDDLFELYEKGQLDELLNK